MKSAVDKKRMATSEFSIDFDVVIIGAGISGICFAHRLQELHPELKYCLLEARDEIGGTWSFFKYPGRSLIGNDPNDVLPYNIDLVILGMW